SISGNVITIDVPVQGGFGPNRPIIGGSLFNVTALSFGRNSAAPNDVYADLDATKSFDYTLANGGNPPPPPPQTGCKITGSGSIATTAGSGRFSLDAHANLKGKAAYSDGTAADFRSTRLTEVTCDQTAHSGTIRGQG